MLNKAILHGRLVADPELRQTTTGVPVASFRVAVDRDFKNKETGEREADFLNVVAWRGTAEFVQRNFVKGQLVIVDGRIQSRNYTDKDGNKRTAVDIQADNVYFGSSKDPLKQLEQTMGGTSYPPPGEFRELDDDGPLPY